MAKDLVVNLQNDWWGSILIAEISVAFAVNAFTVGRDSYRWHLYLALGNFAISLVAFIGNSDGPWPSIREIFYCLLLTVGAYFLTIGVLTVFRVPKQVKCFRCEFVDWPHETDEARTQLNKSSLNEFRRMHWEDERASKIEHE